MDKDNSSSRDLSPPTNAHRAEGGAHTPGPWRAGEVWRPPIMRHLEQPTNANGDVFHGYAIYGRGDNGGEILPTLAAVHNFPNAIHANARLIAAAPELLEALIAFVEPFSDVPNEGLSHHKQGSLAQRIVLARAAIAKALSPATASPAERQGPGPGMTPNPKAPL